jgi:hypothetical protein
MTSNESLSRAPVPAFPAPVSPRSPQVVVPQAAAAVPLTLLDSAYETPNQQKPAASPQQSAAQPPSPPRVAVFGVAPSIIGTVPQSSPPVKQTSPVAPPPIIVLDTAAVTPPAIKSPPSPARPVSPIVLPPPPPAETAFDDSSYDIGAAPAMPRTLPPAKQVSSGIVTPPPETVFDDSSYDIAPPPAEAPGATLLIQRQPSPVRQRPDSPHKETALSQDDDFATFAAEYGLVPATQHTEPPTVTDQQQSQPNLGWVQVAAPAGASATAVPSTGAPVPRMVPSKAAAMGGAPLPRMSIMPRGIPRANPMAMQPQPPPSSGM